MPSTNYVKFSFSQLLTKAPVVEEEEGEALVGVVVEEVEEE